MAKILLVEDDNNLREIYEARLQAEGYQIVSANDGESALVVAKNEKPDLIISDVMMPKISGFEMLDILRNTDELRDVKVIMLTALGQADDQARANKLGADRYLVKSQVTLEDIVKVSHELLDGTAAPSDDSPAAAADPSTTTPPVTTSVPVTAAPTEEPATIAVTPPPTPEPVTPVSVPVSDGSNAQTSASEEANVEKQIQDFVATQPTEAPTMVEPSATVEAPAEPEVTTTETHPSETADSLGDGGAAATPAPSSDQVADDKVMSNAVDTLVADTTDAEGSATPPVTPVTVEPVTPVTPVTEDETPAESSSGSVPIAHKKIIQPLGTANDKPDLDALLAAEEAKEADQASAMPPQPVIGGSEDDAPSGAPTPMPSTQAETTGPEPEKPFDPNSIAL